MVSVVSEHDAQQLRIYLTYLSNVVKSYSWLIDSFVLDFFTENHWSKLPLSWQLILEAVEPPELSLWIDKGKISCKPIWPLSLLSLRVVARVLSLSREPIQSTFSINEFLNKFNKDQEKAENNEPKHSNDKGEFICKNLDHIFTKHVKPKKRHEIGRLAQVSHILLKNLKCCHIVDIGSGQGHLSRLLSLEYGYKVVTVEAVGSHVAGAKKFDSQAITEVQKRRKKNKMNEAYIELSLALPKHLVFHMTESSDGADLIQIVQDAWKENLIEKNHCFGLIGLHTCGDLAVDMLKLFMKTKHISCVVSVACCYMKLDLSKNYPLSDFLREKDSKLTYEAMEIGCHAIDTYIERLRRNADALKIHCYRATLETLILKHYPGRRHVGLHSVRRSDKMSFPMYVQCATKRVNLEIPYDDTTSSYINKCLNEWKHVVVFYSLRLLIAPVIETIVLLDRLMFLYEKGYPCLLIPLFDPALSPRNHLLIGVRPNPQHFTE